MTNKRRQAAAGRNWEGFGADPFLAGAASVATIDRYQGVESLFVTFCAGVESGFLRERGFLHAGIRASIGAGFCAFIDACVPSIDVCVPSIEAFVPSINASLARLPSTHLGPSPLFVFVFVSPFLPSFLPSPMSAFLASAVSTRFWSPHPTHFLSPSGSIPFTSLWLPSTHLPSIPRANHLPHTPTTRCLILQPPNTLHLIHFFFHICSMRVQFPVPLASNSFSIRVQFPVFPGRISVLFELDILY
ncbi:hypothetical protein C8R44DRAFT_886873 [Mycena epipterygia]|nr:hypothetical protein C8R44DRAFT_886873 [Mycena epipterygia]